MTVLVAYNESPQGEAAMRAAVTTRGSSRPSGVGTTMAMRDTPATRAGMAFISTELG